MYAAEPTNELFGFQGFVTKDLIISSIQTVNNIQHLLLTYRIQLRGWFGGMQLKIEMSPEMAKRKIYVLIISSDSNGRFRFFFMYITFLTIC